MFTSTDTILRTMSMVKSVLDANNIKYRFAVYSEGGEADFAEVVLPGVELSKYRVGHYSDPNRMMFRFLGPAQPHLSMSTRSGQCRN